MKARAQFSDLTDELLLKIGSNLPHQDLRMLALASRRFRGPAQEALYNDISVINTWEKFIRFTRTLLQCRNFLPKVRSLEIGQNTGWDEAFKKQRSASHDREAIVSRILDSVKADTLRPDDWQDLEKWDINTTMTVLIHLATNLTRLDVQERALSCFSLHDAGLSTLLSAPVFASLKHLSLSPYAELHWNWCMLPSLQTLKLGNIFLRPSISTDALSSKVRELTLNCNGSVLLPRPDDDDDTLLTMFLRKFDRLTKFRLQLPGYAQYGYLRRTGEYFNEFAASTAYPDSEALWDQASFCNLYKMMASLSPTLEHLQLWVPNERGIDQGRIYSEVPYPAPSPGLRQFACLKSVLLPQWALKYSEAIVDEARSWGSSYIQYRTEKLPASPPRITTKLPASLQVLDMYHVNDEIIPLLQELADSRHTYFVNLKEVWLREYDDDYSWHTRIPWAALEAADITLWFRRSVMSLGGTMGEPSLEELDELERIELEVIWPGRPDNIPSFT
ncbi:hypothetical protein BDV95DRAFT_610143 [Massariosphaeria phaeospora]|uniref:F-box domain-containing protein n=1 Tax=Massariosphaeria phaeospora TaxID=100035 RepID=A0A7C8I1B2_9PLEO|nr:hypothetical protein BDV95DRAFT_610143 [Massariosphaeria phaeospora]